MAIVIVAHTIIWIDDDYFIVRIPWSVTPGRDSDAGAANVLYILELIQYVA